MFGQQQAMSCLFKVTMPLVKMFHLPGSLGHEAGADTCWGFWESFWFPEMCPLFASIFQSGEGDN
jgi:hypothetical protein